MTDVVAVYAATTGTVALLIQLIQHSRDKAKLKLEAGFRGTQLVGQQPELLFQLKMVNVGRRVIIIEEAGIKIPIPDYEDIDKRPLSSTLNFDLPREGVVLNEGQKFTLNFSPVPPELALDLEDEVVVYVKDVTGKEHTTECSVPKEIARHIQSEVATDPPSPNSSDSSEQDK